MQAMFMEDDVVQTTDVDDVRTNMRRALRSDQASQLYMTMVMITRDLQT